MTDNIRAIVAREVEGRTRGSVEEIDALSLPAGDVVVDIACSTLNYKDGLAITGKGSSDSTLHAGHVACRRESFVRQLEQPVM